MDQQIRFCTTSDGVTIAYSAIGDGPPLVYANGWPGHLALELAGQGVTANSLALGLMNNAGDLDSTRALARTIPVGRLGTPEDVGAAVVYLASDEAAWLTGQTIGLNGGSVTS